MELERCIRWLPPAAMLALAAAAFPTAPPGTMAAPATAAPAPLAAGPCSPAAGAPSAAADGGGAAWYRLDPVLDAAGTLAGQRLSAGSTGGDSWTLDLPPESFASGPVGGAILVGDDDGARSRLRLLDAVRGCWTDLAEDRSVIRSAALAPDGATAWEHHIDRVTRADLGIWRRTVPGDRPGGARQVLPGLDPDARYGPTFATDLVATADGRLVVASCGERACRTRVLDPATANVRTAGMTGPVVGVAGRQLVALAPCLGLPCPVVAIDLDSGDARTIGSTAGPAALGGAGDTLLVATTAGGGAVVIDVADPDGRPDRVPGSEGLAPVRRGSTAGSGIEAGPLMVAVAPEGMVTGPSSARLFDPATRTLAGSTEVFP